MRVRGTSEPEVMRVRGRGAHAHARTLLLLLGVLLERARIRVNTLESLLFSQKLAKIWVRFAHKTPIFSSFIINTRSVPGMRRNQDTRLRGSRRDLHEALLLPREEEHELVVEVAAGGPLLKLLLHLLEAPSLPPSCRPLSSEPSLESLIFGYLLEKHPTKRVRFA